jgi:hypothetical protein
MALPRMMLKLWSGIVKRQNKALPKPNAILVGAILTVLV